MKLIYRFDELDNSKVKEVGGKNASLGEMFSQFGAKGIKIPDGFATSSEAYWKFIRENNIGDSLKEALGKLDEKAESLREIGSECRALVLKADIPDDVRKAILGGFGELKSKEESLE